MHQPRTYRNYTKSEDLVSFKIMLAETDLFISCDKDLSAVAQQKIAELREDLESYIAIFPQFKDSLVPVKVGEDAPAIIKDMAKAGQIAEVGPMAAVAGAMAEYVGTELLKYSQQVIVENGGDIFIASKKPRIVGVFAGKSNFSERIAIRIEAEDTPCGVCTSSGTVGHSLSFGKADAALVIAKPVSLADAMATAVGNRVKSKDDIESAISYAKAIKGAEGVLIIVDNTLGAWGKIKFVDN